jgi:hypothetical protein
MGHGEFQGKGKPSQCSKGSRTDHPKGALHGDQKVVCANYQWQKDLILVTSSDSHQKMSWIHLEHLLSMKHLSLTLDSLQKEPSRRIMTSPPTLNVGMET